MISDYCGQKLSEECQCTPEAREIPLCPFWGVEIEILLFLINEGLNQECCHDNKIFYILVLLSSRLTNVPSFM